MIKSDCHRFIYGAVVLFSAVLLFSAPMVAQATGKAKAAKTKPAAKPAKKKKPAAKAEKKATPEVKDEVKPAEPADADTDADEIFTEDDLGGDSAAAPSEEKAAEENEPEPSPLASESDETAEETAAETAVAQEDDEEEADKEEEVEEVVDVDVIESSDPKEGFFPTEFDGPDTVRRDRGFNILTARANRPMALTLVIDHRPYMKLAGEEAEDVFFDYLGLDGGNLKIGLGLRFGIIDGLDVGVYRLNDAGLVPFDTYEFDVRYAFLNQERFFVDMSVRAGLSWFSQKNADDAVGGYGEVFIDHVFFDMLLVGAGFQFHSDSTNDVKNRKDTAYSGAVLGVIEWRMIKQLSLVAEVAASVLGYGSEYGVANQPSFPAFSLGLKILTHRHTFALLVSNTQFINADGIVANSWRDFSDILFGFQILREFNFR